MNSIGNQFLKEFRRWNVTFSKSELQCEKPYKLYIHSRNRTNPGFTSSASVLYNNNGELVDTESRYNGIVSVDVSQYESILSGLELCKKKNIKNVIINTESHLLVKQMGGIWKVKGSELRMLNSKCNTVLTKFNDWNIRHINKEENSMARDLTEKVLKSLEDKYKTQ